MFVGPSAPSLQLRAVGAQWKGANTPFKIKRPSLVKIVNISDPQVLHLGNREGSVYFSG